MRVRAAIFIALILLAGGGLRADHLEMQNGDHYNGKVISMTADTVVLQSDVLGKITLPRGKVANINLGANAAAAPVVRSTNHVKAASLTLTNADPDITTALRHLGANTNFIEQSANSFLSDAGPEANHKYDDLVAGLMNGKFDMESLRARSQGRGRPDQGAKTPGWRRGRYAGFLSGHS